SFTIGIADDDALLLLVHARDLPKDHRRVPLVSQNTPNRRANLTRRQHGGCHLVEQRLKQMMVGSINQQDLHGSVAQGFRGCQPAEAPAYDDNSWLCHTFPCSIQTAAIDAAI